jgi:O-antigen/teichoic acid export membrane protein
MTSVVLKERREESVAMTCEMRSQRSMEKPKSVRGAAGSDKRTLFTNAIWNWLGFAASLAITFFMCPILVHGLGDKRYGVWSLIEATVAYIALLDLGIGASVVRYVARFEAIKDQDQLNRVFSTTLGIFLLTGGIAIAISAGTAALWECPFGLTAALAADGRWLILLLGLNVAVQLVIGVFSAILYGLGRFPAKVLIAICTQSVAASLMLAVLATGGGLVGIAVSILLATLMSGLLTAKAVRWYLPDLHFSPAFANSQTLRAIGGYSALAFATMMAARLAYSSDAIIIGAFLSPQYITFYVIAARLIQYVRSCIDSLMSVLTPAISALEACGDQESIRRVFVVGTRYMLWIILPIETGLLVLGKPFLSLWVGDQYAERSYPPLMILSIPLFLVVSQAAGVRILYGIGRLKWLTATTIVRAVMNIVMSMILINRMGIVGVALATSASQVFYSAALGYYMCRIHGMSILYFTQQSMAKPLAVVSVAGAVWYLAGQFIPPTNWGSLLLIGVLGIFAYLGVAFIVEFGLNGVYYVLRFVDWRRASE